MKGMQRLWLAAAAGAFAIAGCGDSTGPGGTPIEDEWRDNLEAGEVIEIRGVNGGISATAAPGSEAVVSFTIQGVNDDPATVTVEVVEHAGGVTICAVYPDVPGQPVNVCAPGSEYRMSVQDNDVQVTFTVTVPAGVTFVGRTINGGVTGTDLESNAFVSTVNGTLTVSTTQLADATTVNGSITASIGRTNPDRDLPFTTVNGSVTVTVPAAMNADARLTTVSGDVSSDFPLTQGPIGVWTATLGSGGRLLALTTVNGDATLRRGS
jgi:hypothetical protein